MTTTQLQRARALELPDRESMLRPDPLVQRFWDENQDILRDGWADWETDRGDDAFVPDTSLLDSELRQAVETAWQDPSTESAVHELMQEVAPDVFRFQFFDPERLGELRAYLEEVWNAEVPLRPPYGIVLIVGAQCWTHARRVTSQPQASRPSTKRSWTDTCARSPAFCSRK